MIPQAPAPRTASRVIGILTVALGAAVVVGTLWSGAAPTLAASLSHSEGRTVAVDGVDEIDLDVAAASFDLRFDDVDEASLDVRDVGNGSWTLREDDGTLVVRSPERPFFSWWGSGNGEATLILPRELEGVDATVDFGAGSFDAEGDFGELELEVGAGQVDVRGSAESLALDLGAGRADFSLADVRTADLEISAGAVVGELTGDAPQDTQVVVSAGSLDLTVPDEEYDVTSDVSAGDFTSDARTARGATRTLHAEVSAGDVRIRIAD
jgi:hypothetical protein